MHGLRQGVFTSRVKAIGRSVQIRREPLMTDGMVENVDAFD